ncbi:MAG: hypothetical protein U1F68_18225 [Gammaproteobacteria bacterium]
MKYCVRNGKWTGLPGSECVAGIGDFNYRISVKQAGFDKFPENTRIFLRNPAPGVTEDRSSRRFLVGRASGDGNAWAHWLIWAFGGKMVDEQGNVTISPGTIAATTRRSRRARRATPQRHFDLCQVDRRQQGRAR